MDPAKKLVEAVKKADSFEAASQLVLAEVASVIRATLAHDFPESKTNPDPVRASIHVFDGENWRDIASVEWTKHRSAEHTRAETHRSSTLWKLIREHGYPVAVEVYPKTVFIYRPDEIRPVDSNDLEAVDPAATILRGTATHALALPLAQGGGKPVGMLAVHLRSKAPVAQVDWRTTFAALRRRIDEAARELLAMSWPRPNASGLIDIVAMLKDHVLIKGPTGVGKTYLARDIHERSGRTGPFVVYSAQSFPDDLQTAYLLGWKKGAFPGAHADSVGVVAAAVGGTLFVDEVDKLSMSAQRALLLIADKNGMFTPLGAGARTQVVGDVRFIFASNIDLPSAIQQRLFLNDLYFRINVFPISIPSLAQRAAEIPAWCQILLAEIHRERFEEARSMAFSIDSDAIAILMGLEWPGNLRQLNTMLKRAYALAGGEAGEGPVVRVTKGHVEQALALDGTPPQIDVLAKFEALAKAIVQQTKIELRDWVPQEPIKDDENPGLANFVRMYDVLFPMVWREVEREVGDTNRKEVARLIGKLRSLGMGNYAKERDAAFRKRDLTYERHSVRPDTIRER